MSLKTKTLKKRLDNLYRTYASGFLHSDPLEFVHRFKGRRDREIAGLLASSLAYGRVAQIRRSVETVLDIMGGEPYRFTAAFNPKKDKTLFRRFSHRFNTGEDIRCLVYFLKQIFTEHGSIERFFLKGYRPEDANVKNGLVSFSRRVLELDSRGVYGTTTKLPARSGVRFFFPSPSTGGACKRLNLFLRWMVRKDDGLDTGLWKRVEPSKLVIPLDTHIARISRNLGLTERKTPGWPMAEEITGALKALDPDDPVRYDFALSRLGILEECPRRADPVKCGACMLKGICVLKGDPS